MSLFFTALTVAAGMSLPLPWGFDVHRLICEIAWREMTPRTQTHVRSLLALDPEYTAFSEACVWADPASRTSMYARYRTAHYVNVLPEAAGVSIERDCADAICVLEAIEEFSDALRDHDRPGEDRLVAMKFLAHFVGDLHQPLHVGFQEDRGGNSRNVTLNGRTYNLHEVWDRLLIEGADEPRLRAKELHAAVDPIDRTVWGSEHPVDWANESFFVVVNAVYADLARDAVSEEYLLLHRRTAATRITQAGVRLGALLNRLFDTERASSRSPLHGGSGSARERTGRAP